jgi:putative colanic acid biosynthesis glycosyltransferase
MQNSKAKAPLLSIIIVTFNAEAHLPCTLESLSRQPDIVSNDVEVIVIDGGSCDRTLSIVDSCPFIDAVVSEPDEGIYDAMNKGVRRARGEWVQFLNAGDALADSLSLGRILSAGNLLSADSTPWIVVGAQNLGGGSGYVRRIRNVPHVWWKHAYGFQPHCHQACIFRRSTLTAAGLHSLDFGTAGDFDVILRFGLLARPFEVEDICIDYAGGGVSEASARRNPQLQHAIRSYRFQLGPLISPLDELAGYLAGRVNSMRKSAGSARQVLTRHWGNR